MALPQHLSYPVQRAFSSARVLSTSLERARAVTLSRIWQRKMEAKERYRDWGRESLVSRIAELEAQTRALQAVNAKVDTAQGAVDGSAVHSTSSSLASPAAATGDVNPGKKSAKKGEKKEKKAKEFDFDTAPCRKIALRFSYDGAGYSGLAAQNTTSPGAGSSLPTVEAVLWDALCTARLVDPLLGMDGAGFSRCGRTDRGVSAAGQVVALWIRSKKVNHWKLRIEQQSQYSTTPLPTAGEDWESLQARREARLEESELPYVQILNRILPPSIRVQAWSPVRANFSSRFDCVYRHYKYFFPAGPPPLFFPPTGPSSSNLATVDGSTTRLDIGLMREASRKLLGEHDFRNLCKIDASKQITNYRRRIDGVSIDRVSSQWPSTATPVREDEGGDGREDMYVLNLRGTAFLYHQVRNIMAILFLVGARLEAPSVIEELMNTESGAIAADRVKIRLAASTSTPLTANSSREQGAEGEGDGGIKWWLPVNATPTMLPSNSAAPETLPMWIGSALTSEPSVHSSSDASLEVYATKPNYEMAADRPLVLWECGFLPSDVEWRVGAYDGPMCSISPRELEDNQVTASSSLLRMHKTWTQLAISAELSRHFVLASPSASEGTLPSRTSFADAAFPHLSSHATKSPCREKAPGAGEVGGAQRTSGVIPLGNGTGRGAANYIPLKQRPREEPYEVKNRRWAETTGKRRAERKEAEAAAGNRMQDDDE